MTTKKLIPHLEKDIGKMTFGMFLRVNRKRMELTQVEMAKKLKMARGTLCDIEKGRQIVSPQLAVKIAKICKFPNVIAVQLAVQDQLRKANLKYKVKIAA